MIEEIVEFLSRLGWSEEEVAYVRHDLPRWERHLRRRGITVIPGPEPYWSEAEDRAHAELFLLMMQAGEGNERRGQHQPRESTRGRRPRPRGDRPTTEYP